MQNVALKFQAIAEKAKNEIKREVERDFYWRTL